MKFLPQTLVGLVLIETQPQADARGAFVRLSCAESFAANGLPGNFRQSSLSSNALCGTLRGLHFQGAGHPESKLVHCVEGEVFDVVADLRPCSPTFGRWQGFTLSAENGLGLYIPPFLAHGFITLRDNSKLLYQMDADFVAHAARGVRWNDPDLAISWPLAPLLISDRDRALPPLAELTPGDLA
jgi:dTDP-4-dehydrorhamnose 3,5-epimerase